jgi:hypothetical protein
MTLNWCKHAPKFKHDCEKCTFLGNAEIAYQFGEDGTEEEKYPVDLYLCTAHKDPKFWSFLAREGDKGPEYQSGLNPLMQKRAVPIAWETLIVERAKELGIWREK